MADQLSAPEPTCGRCSRSPFLRSHPGSELLTFSSSYEPSKLKSFIARIARNYQILLRSNPLAKTVLHCRGDMNSIQLIYAKAIRIAAVAIVETRQEINANWHEASLHQGGSR